MPGRNSGARAVFCSSGRLNYRFERMAGNEAGTQQAALPPDVLAAIKRESAEQHAGVAVQRKPWAARRHGEAQTQPGCFGRLHGSMRAVAVGIGDGNRTASASWHAVIWSTISAGVQFVRMAWSRVWLLTCTHGLSANCPSSRGVNGRSMSPQGLSTAGPKRWHS